MTRRSIWLAVIALVVTASCGRTLAAPREGSNAMTTDTPGSVAEGPPHPGPPVSINGVGPKGQTTAITSGAGSVWVAAYGVPGGAGADQKAVIRIDASTNEVVATIPTEVVPGWEVGGGGLAYGFGSVWVTGYGHVDGDLEGVLVRIDPATDQVVASVALGGRGGADIAVSSTGVWVAVGGPGQDPGVVARVDPNTNEVTGTVTLQQAYVRRIVATDTAVVASEYTWEGGGGPYVILTAIDPNTLEVTGRYDPHESPDSTSSILVQGNEVVGIVDGSIAPIDTVSAQPGEPTLHFASEAGPRGFIVPTADGYWYGAYPGGTGGSSDNLTYLDASTGEILSFGKAGGIAATIIDGSLWQIFYGGDVTRTDLVTS